MRDAGFICEFSSGLDDLPRKKQRDPDTVLGILRARGRFSVFEATANQTIANMLCDLEEAGRIQTVPLGYPWIEVTHIDGQPLAQGIDARSDETPQAAQPSGESPVPKECAQGEGS